MARNIAIGDNKNTIPFNCYHGVKNEKGRLIKDIKAFDRIYGRFEQVNITRKAIGNVINAGSQETIVVTQSPNKLSENDYIENKITGEVWKIVSITKQMINGEACTSSARVHWEYRLSCSR